MHQLPLVLVLYLLPLFTNPASAASSSSYKWPSQYDDIETLLYEGRRSDGLNLASIVHPCRKRGGTGSNIPAEWLRFAFHDMATHNVDDGTGGLDGSIVYELGNAANFGMGFNDTLNDLNTFPNQRISRADVFAIGAIMAVATCGGPVIPFSAGRVDVWQGGSSDNTPEPQDDINTLKESFRKAGFTQAEMIKLTACGHTMGAVRSTDFPQLVAPNPSSPSTPVIQNFDSTTNFDNAIVTEYLAGSTQNVLVSTPNATMASDLKVFSSDNNATMKSIADPATFQSECKTLLGRMLNVVPKSVTLSSEITLIPAKVTNAQLTFENKKLIFKTSFRLTQPLNQTANAKRVVNMYWCPSSGSNKDCSSSAYSALPVSNITDDTSTISPITSSLGYTFSHYDFLVPIDSSESISKFWFEVDEKDGKKAAVYSNGGGGYVVDQDSVLFVPMMSDSVFVAASSVGLRRRGGGPIGPAVPQAKVYSLVVAVKSSVAPSRVYVDATDVATVNFTQSFSKTVDLTLNTTLPAQDGYSFYTGQVISPGLQMTMDVHAVVGGGQTTSQGFVQTLLLANTPQVDPGNVTTVKGKKVTGSALGGKAALSGWAVVVTVMSVLLGTLL